IEARTWRQPASILHVLGVAGRDHIYHYGDIRGARARFTGLLSAAERYGSIAAQAEALVQLALCEATLGDLDAGENALRLARSLVARLGPSHRLPLVAATAVQIVIALLRGEEDWQTLAATTSEL